MVQAPISPTHHLTHKHRSRTATPSTTWGSWARRWSSRAPSTRPAPRWPRATARFTSTSRVGGPGSLLSWGKGGEEGALGQGPPARGYSSSFIQAHPAADRSNGHYLASHSSSPQVSSPPLTSTVQDRRSRSCGAPRARSSASSRRRRSGRCGARPRRRGGTPSCSRGSVSRLNPPPWVRGRPGVVAMRLEFLVCKGLQAPACKPAAPQQTCAGRCQDLPQLGSFTVGRAMWTHPVTIALGPAERSKPLAPRFPGACRSGAGRALCLLPGPELAGRLTVGWMESAMGKLKSPNPSPQRRKGAQKRTRVAAAGMRGPGTRGEDRQRPEREWATSVLTPVTPFKLSHKLSPRCLRPPLRAHMA